VCSADIECGYATKRKASSFAHYEDPKVQEWLDEHPQCHEDGLVSIKSWHVGGNFFWRKDETEEEYVARRRASGWIPMSEAMPLAREYGRKLKAKSPERRVFIRENYWCSGTEITVLEEIADDGNIIKHKRF